MLEKAARFLRESVIDPNARVVEFSDQDNIDRIFIINDKGGATEVKPSFDFVAKETLYVNTLTGLIDYIKDGRERGELDLYVHVEDEETVILQSPLLQNGDRETLVIANAIVPDFKYEYYHDTEELIIALQSKFTRVAKGDDRELLLKVVGNVKEENIRATGDDGMSQAVTIRSGVSSVEGVKVPNPVALAPYRTFLEVEQPESDFIFRMKDGPRGAIFEADGGIWRNEAIDNVSKYLAKELKEEVASGRITIIA